MQKLGGRGTQLLIYTYHYIKILSVCVCVCVSDGSVMFMTSDA